MVWQIYIVLFSLLCIATPVFASETNGTIDSNYAFAWGENLGWINLKPDNEGLSITDTAITGFAWSTIGGWINFSPTSEGVTNDQNGTLSGYAWSSQKGWINMSGITIDTSGKFTGTAGTLGTAAGRITFSCDTCDVRTDWRPASVRVSPTQSTGVGISSALPEKSTHIEAYNTDLVIDSEQSGTYTAFTDVGQIIMDVPLGGVISKTTISIINEPLTLNNARLLPTNTTLLHNSFFTLIAKDQQGNSIDSFLLPVTVTLPLPKNLSVEDSAGVYRLYQSTNTWILVPDAIINLTAGTVRFQTNLPATFAIFTTENMPATLSFPSKTTDAVDSANDILVSPSDTENQTTTKQFNLPRQRATINFEIDETTIDNIDELNSRIIFEGFGKTPTPIDMTFTIIDANGKNVYKTKETIEIETDTTIQKQFDDVKLAPGTYTIILDTIYNNTITNELRKTFTITGTVKEISSYAAWKKPIYSLLLLGASSFLAIQLIKKYRKI